MAAATKSGYTSSVFGNERVSQWTSAAFASSGDTITVNSMKKIKSINYTPTTNASFGFTVSGNVATIVSGGALTGILQVIGS